MFFADAKMKTKSFPHELIGEEITVVGSTNPAQVGISGKIVDETKSTIKIQSKEGTKTLLKNTITFKIKSKAMVIEGKTLIKRPEERLKR